MIRSIPCLRVCMLQLNTGLDMFNQLKQNFMFDVVVQFHLVTSESTHVD